MNNAYLEAMNRVQAAYSRDNRPKRKWFFEVREGDGNQGEFHRCNIEADNAFDALIAAHRHGYIASPWDVRITKDCDGDNISAHVMSYVQPIYGDSCRWCASATLAIELNDHDRKKGTDTRFAKAQADAEAAWREEKAEFEARYKTIAKVEG